MFDCFGGSKSSPVTMGVGAEALGEGEGIALRWLRKEVCGEVTECHFEALVEEGGVR
jgi:hypothetical protein